MFLSNWNISMRHHNRGILLFSAKILDAVKDSTHAPFFLQEAKIEKI